MSFLQTQDGILYKPMGELALAQDATKSDADRVPLYTEEFNQLKAGRL